MFAERPPQYNIYKSLRAGIYTIEGIVGVGKTTLGKAIEQFLNEIGISAKFYPEYVNALLLSQYISNMEKYAYGFQLVMLFKRLEIYREAERFAATGAVAIIDRSLVGDLTFAQMQKVNGNFTMEEWETYLSVAKQEIQLTPTASIYLKCSPEVALERIKKRGIEAEIKGYSLNYLEQLNNAYEHAIANCTNVRHIIVDWNTEFDDNSVVNILTLLL